LDFDLIRRLAAFVARRDSIGTFAGINLRNQASPSPRGSPASGAQSAAGCCRWTCTAPTRPALPTASERRAASRPGSATISHWRRRSTPASISPALAAARRDVEDRVSHRTQISGSRSASSFRRRQQRRDQRPLATRQVAWIAHGNASMLCPSGIIPRHPVSPSPRQRRRITKA
jgi:hypothetical protein